ncbi:MAG: hypothetical protein LBM20_04895 [Rikenellaceae bacterium]|jgi:heme/copper-type cytochrome/quinol oxidase subunit 2|nr:hypothetical protein [Rikenellaceae bacterium]
METIDPQPQQQTQQPNYYRPARPTEPVSVGQWFLTIFITAIPLVGLIMYFVWAFGDNTSESKANWAKASLLWMVVSVALFLIFLFFFGGMMLLFGSQF